MLGRHGAQTALGQRRPTGGTTQPRHGRQRPGVLGEVLPYWDVEPRIVPMAGDRFHLTASEAVTPCDENTIGVVAMLGCTFDGSYEPVAEMADALDATARGEGRTCRSTSTARRAG